MKWFVRALVLGVLLLTGALASARVPKVSPWPAPAGGSPTLTFLGYSTDFTTSISFPGGIASGDVSYIFNFAYSTTTPPSDVTPSSFSAIGTSQTATGGGVGYRWSMWEKVLSGSETTVTGMTGGIQQLWLNLVFRKTSGTWGAASSIGNQAAASGAGGTSSKSVTVGAAPLVVVCVTVNSGAGIATLTPTETGAVGDAAIYGAYTIYASSPSNSTCADTAPSSGLAIGAFYSAVTP